MIAASGAVKHEDIVDQVNKLFTKLSTDGTTTAQLVAKEPAIFTGSEVRIFVLTLEDLKPFLLVYLITIFVYFLPGKTG